MCEFTVASLQELPNRSGWRAEHFVLMPNHVHLLLRAGDDAKSLRSVLRGWKWHVANEANRLLGRLGRFWQADWFDRWARDEAEEIRMGDYIRQNPVKAGLAEAWQDYPWVR